MGIAILLILLALAVGVVVFQRRQSSILLHNRQCEDKMQKQIPNLHSPKDWHSYDNATVSDEHQYLSIESRKQVAHYQNMP